jgi:hypothetical protein
MAEAARSETKSGAVDDGVLTSLSLLLPFPFSVPACWAGPWMRTGVLSFNPSASLGGGLLLSLSTVEVSLPPLGNHDSPLRLR